MLSIDLAQGQMMLLIAPCSRRYGIYTIRDLSGGMMLLVDLSRHDMLLIDITLVEIISMESIGLALSKMLSICEQVTRGFLRDHIQAY